MKLQRFFVIVLTALFVLSLAVPVLAVSVQSTEEANTDPAVTGTEDQVKVGKLPLELKCEKTYSYNSASTKWDTTLQFSRIAVGAAGDPNATITWWLDFDGEPGSSHTIPLTNTASNDENTYHTELDPGQTRNITIGVHISRKEDILDENNKLLASKEENFLLPVHFEAPTDLRQGFVFELSGLKRKDVEDFVATEGTSITLTATCLIPSGTMKLIMDRTGDAQIKWKDGNLHEGYPQYFDINANEAETGTRTPKRRTYTGTVQGLEGTVELRASGSFAWQPNDEGADAIVKFEDVPIGTIEVEKATAPSPDQTQEPSEQPSPDQTQEPSEQPSPDQTQEPSEQPSPDQTEVPSGKPSPDQTEVPSDKPSPDQTEVPSGKPFPDQTEVPSDRPSEQPSVQPSTQPSDQSSAQPSGQPSGQPSEQPSSKPSIQPSGQPSAQLSAQPSRAPLVELSPEPSEAPSTLPTAEPLAQPLIEPSAEPTTESSVEPSPSDASTSRHYVHVFPGTLKVMAEATNGTGIAQSISLSHPEFMRDGNDTLDCFDYDDGLYATVVDPYGEEVPSNELVSTGNMAVFRDKNTDEVFVIYSLVVPKDVIGRAEMNLSQVVRLAQIFKRSQSASAGNPVSTVVMLAGDNNGNGYIDLTDLVQQAKCYKTTRMQSPSLRTE